MGKNTSYNFPSNRGLTDREVCLRRDYKKKEDWFWVKVAAIFFIGALAYFLYTIVPTVEAEDSIGYQEVNSIEAVCAYLELYPEKITNRAELAEHCL